MGENRREKRGEHRTENGGGKNGKEMVLCQFMLCVALFGFMLGSNISS